MSRKDQIRSLVINDLGKCTLCLDLYKQYYFSKKYNLSRVEYCPKCILMYTGITNPEKYYETFYKIYDNPVMKLAPFNSSEEELEEDLNKDIEYTLYAKNYCKRIYCLESSFPFNLVEVKTLDEKKMIERTSILKFIT